MTELMRRKPSEVVKKWPDLFDNFFENFWDGWRVPELRTVERAFVPAIDVLEEEDKVIVKAEMPGMTKDDIEVTVEHNMLYIKGEKKQEEEYNKGNVHRVERSYGSFERSMQLPEYVDCEKIKAGFKDGVLTLTMPKAESHKPKQVKIE